MDIQWLKSFVLTAQNKSLSKTSEWLNLSQPAVSKQIRKLEETYGVTLFYRSTQGVELTKAGAMLLERIQPVLMDLELIYKELQDFKTTQKIWLGALPSIATYFLRRKIPTLEVNTDVMVCNTSTELLSWLKAGKLDAALIDKRSADPHLWSKDLFSESYLAILPKSHPLGEQQCVTVADIKDESFVFYPESCDVRQCITQRLLMLGIEPKVSTEVSFGDFILGYVAAGAGITILPKIVTENLSVVSLTAVPIIDFNTTRTISIIARSEKLGKRLYRSFDPSVYKES
ncbi:LysR family transcriptional regulator [Paenibacillus aestuarii]|uniref:LysR family transcriptional regulator n=1 Tax=Paenibacillus aestuarii TaxID=516965 RepID=A0ABW0KFW9_9BACL|nr:LysR family transcriptional regulator [Paenibacillus aestuarii]